MVDRPSHRHSDRSWPVCERKMSRNSSEIEPVCGSAIAPNWRINSLRCLTSQGSTRPLPLRVR